MTATSIPSIPSISSISEPAPLPEFPRICGEFVVESDPRYDELRETFDNRVDYRPAVIARPKGTADVVAAIGYARENGLEVSVRSGGHNPNGYSSNNGGLVIDMRLMSVITVDPDSRTATVAGGALAGDVVAEAGLYGLAAVTGTLPPIGFAGLIQGGGEGFLTPHYGMACDQVIGVTLVTAAGDVVRATETHNSDLLYGIKGAGANFGVLTSIDIKLFPLAHDVLAGVITGAPARDGFAAYLENLLTVYQGLSDWVFPTLFATADLEGNPLVTVMLCHIGPPEIARAEVDQILAALNPVDGEVVAIPYPQAPGFLHDSLGYADGGCSWWEDREICVDIAGFAKGVELVLDQLFVNFETGDNATVVMYGCVNSNPPAVPSATHQRAGLGMTTEISVEWHGAEHKEDFEAKGRAISATLKEHGIVTDVCGYLHGHSDVTPEMIAETLGPDAMGKLAVLKAKYDPENFFHRNYNVLPASETA